MEASQEKRRSLGRVDKLIKENRLPTEENSRCAILKILLLLLLFSSVVLPENDGCIPLLFPIFRLTLMCHTRIP